MSFNGYYHEKGKNNLNKVDVVGNGLRFFNL
jgi:hypothetical protein